MEIAEQMACPCRPGFIYKDMKLHKKSKMHKAWESIQEVKDVRIKSKQFENKIARLKKRLEHKEAIETELLLRIHQLEYEVEYLKNACNGVYVN